MKLKKSLVKPEKPAIIAGGTTEQHVIIAGFLPRHWLYEWFSRAEQPNNTLYYKVLFGCSARENHS